MSWWKRNDGAADAHGASGRTNGKDRAGSSAGVDDKSRSALPTLPAGTRERERLHVVSVILNGTPRQAMCEPRALLSDFLRHDLGATGTHVGCEHGVCGACTVRVDGVASRACLTLALSIDGARVDTVEGLTEAEDTLNDLQQAFQRHHALQCGFCTAGILMSSADYLERVTDPSEADLREMLSGHLCRCTGYTPIVAAVLDVAARRRNAADKRHAPTGAQAERQVQAHQVDVRQVEIRNA